MPDAAPHLLDTNATRLRKVLLRRLSGTLAWMPYECACHLNRFPPSFYRDRARGGTMRYLSRLGARAIRQTARLDAALPRDLLDGRELEEPIHRRANHVVRIGRAKALRENV